MTAVVAILLIAPLCITCTMAVLLALEKVTEAIDNVAASIDNASEERTRVELDNVG